MDSEQAEIQLMQLQLLLLTYLEALTLCHFSDAFDCVNHEKLLHKINTYFGFKGYAARVFILQKKAVWASANIVYNILIYLALFIRSAKSYRDSQKKSNFTLNSDVHEHSSSVWFYNRLTDSTFYLCLKQFRIKIKISYRTSFLFSWRLCDHTPYVI